MGARVALLKFDYAIEAAPSQQRNTPIDPSAQRARLQSAQCRRRLHVDDVCAQIHKAKIVLNGSRDVTRMDAMWEVRELSTV